ncbi:pancreatic secretory granule membrane major glycoprotein GP2-like [Carassius auratus]|uniref:Pancreatic secretory granule membrane major glycoprotein GP2-like n=1 Tax=Carassius auratus TaxID=7957 RepID=A0A6P6JCS8_CARAU|nr:pancreatic secretory granule membrane major glycoprotein GP2-like [Carassius auratus]
MTGYQKSKVFLHLVTLLCAVRSISGECEISQCSDPSTCSLSQRRTCKCAIGFFGDLCDQVAIMNVTCGKDFISILVDEEFFKYYNVGIEAVHLSNASCRAHREEISGSVYFMVHTPMDQYTACGGKPLEKNITHIVYSLTMMSDPLIYGNIVRDPVVQLEYKCIYPYTRRLSLEFPIISFSSERMFKVSEVDAKVEMSLFKDHTYTEAFTSAPTIKLGDQIYVQIQVTEPEDFFHLKVNECWATQTPQANDKSGFSHSLLVNGCTNDKTTSFGNGTAHPAGRNGEGSTVRYSFDMFRFVYEPHIFYLHCAVHLCTPEDGKSCIPECKSVSKREVVMNEQAQGLLSYGPIRRELPVQPNINLLALVLPLAVIWTLGIFLFVLISIAKAGNRRHMTNS